MTPSSPSLNHPIVLESFAIIDREIGAHSFSAAEYAIVRRIIHSTADFEFRGLVQFSCGAIEGAIAALQQGCPIITDVSMVRQGITTLVAKTFNSPIWVAVEQAPVVPDVGRTRTEMGMEYCWNQVSGGIFVVGNAPTALLTLCRACRATPQKPALVIGAPVGFVAVETAKAVLADTPVPQIRVEGRKGGSSVAAAIVNALLILAWEAQEHGHGT
ncbi:MAG: precorrin-8X methylmutase [Cyanobacteria bacterium J06638_22]